MQTISIKTITFYNLENHYAIIKDENNDVYQGTIFYPYKTQKLQVICEPINTSYGEQFKIISLIYLEPNLPNEFISLLTTGLFPKIGQKTAEKIIFGCDISNLWNNPVSSLINLKINKNLKESIEKNLEIYKNFILLHSKISKKGFTSEHIIKINEVFGKESYSLLESNPYQFYKKIPLLTFKFLDTIAESLGIDKNSSNRILAGTYACIDEYCEQYKCSGIEFNKLSEIGSLFLSIDSGIYYSTLNHLLDDKKLCEITINDELLISTPQIYFTELGISNCIKKLNTNLLNKKLSITLPEFLSSEQQNAIKQLLNNKLAILTGMPGSGKTTIIQYAIENFRKNNPNKKVFIGTPTGKASQRVKETNPNLNVSTNHKLLKFLPNGSFLFNENNLLDVDLLILDETSMIDMYMFYSILKALPINCQLWIIGDSNQLASIQLGNVLLDLINSKIIHHSHLSEVFRQEKNSAILENAIKAINKEEILQTKNINDQDFYIFNKKIEKEIAISTIDLFFQIKKNKNYSFNQLQILCPQKTTLCGIDYLNSEIQSALFKNETAVKWKDKYFYVGDKIIQTVNDYDRDIFNGDIGFITSIDINNYQIIANFNNQSILYEKGQIEQIDLAYAISIHKFQGSEATAILLPISRNFSKMLTPKLIYTAMTRAKQLLVINGDLDILNHSIKHNHDIERKTFLSYFLITN